jgi:hypothetical protein
VARREKFENDVNDEFERRTNMAKVDDAMKSAGGEEISTDKYWSDMAETHLTVLSSDAERQRVRDLVQQFAIAHHRFNEHPSSTWRRSKNLGSSNKGCKPFKHFHVFVVLPRTQFSLAKSHLLTITTLPLLPLRCDAAE